MSSRHHSSAQLIKRGLYDDLKSFAELERRISALGDENTKVVGDAFEVFVEAYLATQQKLQTDSVWLVGQLPYEIRQTLNLPNDAKGIDGVFQTRTGVLVPYQVKFRSHRSYLTYTEIAPFLGLTERATDRIVFTNSDELADDVKNRDAMRTVRGIDFDQLTGDDLRAISAWLREKPVTIQKPSPYPYQLEALSQIADTLAQHDRAQIVMACGTGKTLVALWAVERLNPKTVLVLVPSLTLLQQTLDEWSRYNNWGKSFTYLCVCSDPTVASSDEDAIRLDRTELEFKVDTDSDEVRRFIERDNRAVKVVFSTYHSSAVVSAGVRGLQPFDVAVFDEAHKTTGPKGRSFAHCLAEENIKIRKRLFLTATPRHYEIRKQSYEGDFEIESMDDPAVYGPRAYTLSFGAAAKKGIICSYQVLISLVDGKEVNDFALKYGITLVDGDVIGAKWVASQIAIQRAVEKVGAKRVITFHSRVSSAEEFSSESSRGVQQFLTDFRVYHVNGRQHSSLRKQIIRAFREADKALITNARCLTEGIDVPAVDMVAFIDPRHSKIDIAQATGRALRKVQGSGKSVGYIVVPLFLDRRAGETLEKALERTEFNDIANVLNAIQEQDEELVEIVCELMQVKGRGGMFNPQPLSDKVTVLGPMIDLTTLQTNIFVEIVDALGSFWDEMYGRLVVYFKAHGHSNVPQHYKDKQLGNWVKKLRGRRDRLNPARVALLERLRFVWDALDEKWDEMYDQLAAFYRANGHTNIPTNHPNQKLLRWMATQRRETNLTLERKSRLNQLRFVWSRVEHRWEDLFNRLVAYKRDHGDVNTLHRADRALSTWVRAQRREKKQGLLSADRLEKLEQIGLVWKGEDILKNAHGHTQETFEKLAIAVLRGVGRPMRSGELIRAFRRRGHPLPGNEVRTAWNRLWTARKKGILINDPRLGYWIAGEPLSEKGKEKAALAAQGRLRQRGASLRALAKGKKKGPPPALTPKDVQRAEHLLLAGKTLSEVSAFLGGISVSTLVKYTGRISALKAKYPLVSIPKRPYVSRPRRPGLKGVGRPPALTLDQAREMVEMRAQGKTLNEIATLMRVKRSTVWKYLKKVSALSQSQTIGLEAEGNAPPET
jgi:superfamily II DNA or RNA helicase